MDHAFVFVAGLHRSGTTLLFRILRDHPKISGFHIPNGAEREHEGQHLQTVYAPDTQLGGPGYFAFNPVSRLIETSDLVSDANRNRLFEQWSRHWDLSRPLLLEKSPANLLRTRFLQAMFPNSFFVSILRHPVATSLASFKWMGWPRYVVEPTRAKVGVGANYTVRDAEKTDIKQFWKSRRLLTESMLYTLFRHWVIAHQIYFEDAYSLKQKITVRYEDLIENPNRELKKLYKFLQIPMAASREAQSVSDHNQKYFDQWKSIPEAELSIEGRRFLIQTFQSVVNRYGYSLEKLGEIGNLKHYSKFSEVT